jgi:hypothetical protein
VLSGVVIAVAVIAAALAAAAWWRSMRARRKATARFRRGGPVDVVGRNPALLSPLALPPL